MSNSNTIDLSGLPPGVVITVYGKDDKDLLRIYTDGTVKWKGSIDELSLRFIELIEHHINKMSCCERLIDKAYRQTLENILKRTENMTKEELIRSLQTEIDIKKQMEVYLELKGEDI